MAKQKGREVRLFINSTGKGLWLRLVYGRGNLETTTSTSERTLEDQGMTFDSINVEKWMEFGMRAIVGRTTRNDIAS